MPPAVDEFEVVSRYNSSRNPANVYEVRRYADGRLWCTCNKFRFCKAPKTCRHAERVKQGLDDDVAIREREGRIDLAVRALRSVKMSLCETEPGGRWATLSFTPGSQAERAAAGRLLPALEAVGLFAPREAPRAAGSVKGRGARLITLDDD